MPGVTRCIAFSCATLWLGTAATAVAGAAPRTGEAVYAQYCASCHDQTSPRIPPRTALKAVSSARIVRTWVAGVRMSVAYPLRRDERAAVASFLGTSDADNQLPGSAFCRDHNPSQPGATAARWNGSMTSAT